MSVPNWTIWFYYVEKLSIRQTCLWVKSDVSFMHMSNVSKCANVLMMNCLGMAAAARTWKRIWMDQNNKREGSAAESKNETQNVIFPTTTTTFRKQKVNLVCDFRSSSVWFWIIIIVVVQSVCYLRIYSENTLWVSIVVRLTSSLTGLDSTKLVNLYLI